MYFIADTSCTQYFGGRLSLISLISVKIITKACFLTIPNAMGWHVPLSRVLGGLLEMLCA